MMNHSSVRDYKRNWDREVYHSHVLEEVNGIP